MSLRHFMSDRLTDPNSLIKAQIIKRAVTTLNQRTFDSMVRRLSDFIEDRGAKDIDFHMFAIAVGEQGQLPHADLKYLWDNAFKVYGDTDDAKRFLGTLQMYCMTISEYPWVFVSDSEKADKLANGEIPEATKYFIDKKSKPKVSISDLMSKFNKPFKKE